MIVYDVAMKVLDTKSFPQHNIAGLISDSTFIVLFQSEKASTVEENKHTLTHTHTHTHTHIHTHTHNSMNSRHPWQTHIRVKRSDRKPFVLILDLILVYTT